MSKISINIFYPGVLVTLCAVTLCEMMKIERTNMTHDLKREVKGYSIGERNILSFIAAVKMRGKNPKSTSP